MKELSEKKSEKIFTRESIIGLGDTSFRKSHYNELQDRLFELEKMNTRNRALITTIPDFLLVSTKDGNIEPFEGSNKCQNYIMSGILSDAEIIGEIKKIIAKVYETKDLSTYNFSFKMYDFEYFFEARINISELEEILIIIRDMTERVMLEMELREMAEHDSLTKLYNRHYFMEKLNAIDGKYDKNVTVLLIDIDGLKIVNDTLGHPYGDMIIAAVAKILKELYEKVGILSRIGGDEFAVLLIDYSQEEIEKMIEKMTSCMEKHNETESLKMSVSSGYSFKSEGATRSNAMFQEADNNMYQNKLLKESSNRSSLVKTLMKTLEVKDFITEGHADRLEDLSIKIAKALKLPQHQIDRIKLLAKFHDIGKVGIPDRILCKPGRLLDDEWVIMKTHSNIGKRIAEASTELNEISGLILFHHERYDGQGYPLGLIGLEIPVECRILSIVDAFDAMTNDRPYRKALFIDAAIEEINNNSGKQFDPDLVKVFNLLVNVNA